MNKKLAASLLAASTAFLCAGAQAETGKLLLTGGVSSIDGAAGGGLTPWAVIGSNATDDEVGGSAYVTTVGTRDYGLNIYGAAVGIHDRYELSIAQQDTWAWPAAAGLPFLIFDNFSNSQRGVLQRMGQIGGTAPAVVEGDVRDGRALDHLFGEYAISAVVHFAGLKAVGESVAQPARYYDNNVAGSISLVRAMERAGVRQLVFSSSATVYGDPVAVPVPESAVGRHRPTRMAGAS